MRLTNWQVNEVNIVVKCFNIFPIPKLDFYKAQQCLPRLPQLPLVVNCLDKRRKIVTRGAQHILLILYFSSFDRL